GSLVARIPLAELVAKREYAFLGAGFLFVATRAADRGVEAEFADRLEQRHRLRGIAAIGLQAQAHAAAPDRVLDAAHDEPLAERRRAPIAKRDHLRKIMTGVDVHQR